MQGRLPSGPVNYATRPATGRYDEILSLPLCRCLGTNHGRLTTFLTKNSLPAPKAKLCS